MGSRVRIHTVTQPDSDVTTFVLSCDRLDVLAKTIRSFFDTNTHNTKLVIVDDSGKEGVFEQLVQSYGNRFDVVCFPTNRSQWWAMDFMVSYCDTPYIFYLEDDWKFLDSGYIETSKQVLEKYRDIGVVDLSLRTFEEQGIDSYEKELIDDSFYYKKMWRISDYHLHWYGWIGSPNLKRRDDLILLGRVEKWHNEWNIDRRFLGLGFKAVFLKDRYVEHLGDNCSRMEGKRPNDGTTPEDYYPKELLDNRTFPKFDYLQWDKHWEHPDNITIVTGIFDIGREDRNFEQHYVEGIKKLLETRHPIVVFCDPKYEQQIREIRNNRITVVHHTLDDLNEILKHTKPITDNPDWYNQSEWMKTSVIRNQYYIPLTLKKQYLLQYCTETNPFNSKYFYWVDSGIYSSYHVPHNINQYYFGRIPRDNFFMTTFPYYPDKEIHGYDTDYIRSIGYKNWVCRATIFGGTEKQINDVTHEFTREIAQSISNKTIGTEEAIYTMVALKQPGLFDLHHMENGDINNFLKRLM